MVRIFMHNLQNKKSCKVVVCYLVGINASDNFSQIVYADDNTPYSTEDCVKKIYRK